MTKNWLLIVTTLLFLISGCTPNPRPLNQQPQQSTLDFPDYRNDLGWSTNKQHDTSRNPLKDNPNPNAGQDNWQHGIDRVGNRLGDGVYDAHHHEYLKDANSDGILDGDRTGMNQTPLVDDQHLDWFDEDNY